MNILLLCAQAQAAEPWNLQYEKVASFKAKVVDVLCELTGDCPENCGGGKRQLGLLKADGTLHLAVKGVNDFAGAVNDLIPYCGKYIEVDGLLIKNPLATMYFLQRLRVSPSGKWVPATQFMKDWQAANPGIKGLWFRNDPLVKEIITNDGVYGIPGLKPPSK